MDSQEYTQALAAIAGHLKALDALVMAIASTHPDPSALREAWQRLLPVASEQLEASPLASQSLVAHLARMSALVDGLQR